jgi:hemoglobin
MPPTLAEWIGPDKLQALTARFYQRVAGDPILAPVFAGMDPKHPAHVAAFITEVFGGGTPYTSAGGSHGGMIARHMGRRLTEVQRRRWMDLMIDTADEVGVPADPEFRSTFVAYLEWGTRLAVMNSQEGEAPPSGTTPMPKWDWGPAGRPWVDEG